MAHNKQVVSYLHKTKDAPNLFDAAAEATGQEVTKLIATKDSQGGYKVHWEEENIITARNSAHTYVFLDR
jgi:hypothetical protein